ncbi:YdeI/OmpD-associated family protein [Nonlabens xiamenensis]|uniref:YdeI/OmpD-associated family protein n=1 Tax=Nonlabens xiamenensis TaxID=2341043 RepID=UPI000F606800|nr:YdeI/OmpD-associated family protein [Nonlabens xiamenensis]
MIYEFKATLNHDGFTGAILIPEDIAAQLAQDRVKRVVAELFHDDRSLTLYAGVLKKKGVVYLMFSKAKRKELEVEPGDTINVQMKEDTSKYQAPMTEELEAVLLSDYEAYQIFEQLLPGKQRNIIFMVYKAKDSQKRVDIALNAMENLKMGNADPMKFEKLL